MLLPAGDTGDTKIKQAAFPTNDLATVRGFSLIELLIVISIIAIIASLAIPNLLKSRAAANEAAAVSYTRNWTNAQEIYYLKYGIYATALNNLQNEGLIPSGGVDNPPWVEEISGYRFRLSGSNPQLTWQGNGEPMNPGETGSRYFYINETGRPIWGALQFAANKSRDTEVHKV